MTCARNVDDVTAKELFPRLVTLGEFDLKKRLTRQDFIEQFGTENEEVYDIALEHFDTANTGSLEPADLQEMIKESDAAFHRNRAVSMQSFAFSANERSKFIRAYFDKLPPDENLKGGETDWYLSATEFVSCWYKARGFCPSQRAVDRVLSAYPDGRIPITEFARTCTLDPNNFGCLPFPVAYVKMQFSKYREMVGILMYLPFVVLFTILLMTGKGLSNGFFMHEQVTSAFLDQNFLFGEEAATYNSIGGPPDFYTWLRDVVVPGLWVSGNAEGATRPIQFHAYPVGALRVESIRIESVNETDEWDFYFKETTDKVLSPEDKKVIAALFPNAQTGDRGLAYRPMSAATVDQAPFRQSSIADDSTAPQILKDAFAFRACPYHRNAPLITGSIGTYPCGGYALWIPYNSTGAEALSAINGLEKHNWIDGQTRAVLVHFLLFNKDLTLFIRSIVGFEIAAGGYWSPIRRSYVVDYFSFQKQSGGWYFVVILFWLVLFSRIVLHVWGLARKMRVRAEVLGLGWGEKIADDTNYGSKQSFIRVHFHAFCSTLFFGDMWDLIDLLCYALFMGTWVFSALIWSRTPTFAVYDVVNYPFVLDKYASDIETAVYLDAFTAFFVYVKLFKYLKFFRVLRAIAQTITRSVVDLIGIAFAFIVFLFGFAFMGHTVYGGVLINFGTMGETLETLLRFVVEDFEYQEWRETRRIVTPIFFALLQVFLVVVLLNLICAVLADTFSSIVSTRQFHAEAVRSTIRSDPSCSLTLSSRVNPVRTTFWQEMQGRILWLRRFWGQSQQPAVVSRKSEIASRVAEVRGFPIASWDFIGNTVSDIYMADKKQSIEALFDFREILKVAAVDPALSDDRLEFVMSQLHADQIEKLEIQKGHRTLLELLLTEFGKSTDFCVILGVYLPRELIGVSSGDLVVEMMEARDSWQQQIDEHAHVEKDIRDHVDLVERELNKTADEIAPLPSSSAVASQQPQSPNVPFGAALPSGSRGLVVPELEEEEERIENQLRTCAIFLGMDKEQIDKITALSTNDPDFDAKVEEFKEHWRTRQTEGRKYRGTDEGVDVKALGDVVFENRDWMNFKPASIIDAKERRAMKCGWSAAKKKRFSVLARDVTPKTKVALSLFDCLWKQEADGESVPEFLMKEFKQISNMVFGDENHINLEKFLDCCTMNNECHSCMSFEANYFRVRGEQVRNVIELLWYLPFLALFSILILHSFGLGQSAYCTASISNSLNSEGFGEATSEAAFFHWLQESVVPSLFSADANSVGGAMPDGANVGVGALRIRQLRSRLKKDCAYRPSDTLRNSQGSWYKQRIDEHFSGACVPRWGSAQEDESTFHPSQSVALPVTNAFSYNDCPTVRSKIYGRVAQGSYQCGGYHLDLPFNIPSTTAIDYINQLQNSSWITDRTRALITDLFVFNYNLDLFVRMQFLIETTAGGAWITTVRTDTFKLFNPSVQVFTVSISVLFLMFLIANITVYVNSIVSTIRLRKLHRRFSPFRCFIEFVKSNPWSVFDFVNFLLFIASWVFHFIHFARGSADVKLYDIANFPETLIFQAELCNLIIITTAFNALLSYVKVFYFVRLHSSLNPLTKTLNRAASALISVLLISAIVLTAFAIAGHIVFGHNIEGMASLRVVYETLALAILDPMTDDSWYRVDSIFTGFYAALFAIAVVVLIFNMVTSVFTAAHSSAKADEFDSSQVKGALLADPSFMERSVFENLMDSVAVREITYFFKRIFVLATCEANKEYLLKIQLENYRTLYDILSTLLGTVAHSPPEDSAIAAADLLCVLKTISSTMKTSHTFSAVSRRIQITMQLSKKFMLFGYHRPSVKELVVHTLPQQMYLTVMFWCVVLPQRSLGVAQAGLLIDALEANALWEKQAKAYCNIGEVEDDGDDEKEISDRLTSTVESCVQRISDRLDSSP